MCASTNRIMAHHSGINHLVANSPRFFHNALVPSQAERKPRMFQLNMWCYPWDLVDEDLDEVLDRLKGEAGVSGISVATNYHAIDQLRAHPGVLPKRFYSVGGAQFQPESNRYANTRLKPTVARWLRSRNPLARLAEKCDRRNLRLRAWTVCCHCDFTLEKYENYAVKNVFGDPDPTWLCPANPDVRECLRAMVEDLASNYGFETIELERPSFQERPHVHAHQKVGSELGSLGHWLSNLCFCESCRQKAKNLGLDVDAAAKTTADTLEAILQHDQALNISLDQFINEHPALSEFTTWRCKEVNSMVETIGQSSPAPLVIHRDGGRFIAGTDWPALAPFCRATLSNCPEPYTDQAIEQTINQARQDDATLVRALSLAARMGVPSANLYNYGLIPLSRLQWIKQAARYIHRETV